MSHRATNSLKIGFKWNALPLCVPHIILPSALSFHLKLFSIQKKGWNKCDRTDKKELISEHDVMCTNKRQVEEVCVRISLDARKHLPLHLYLGHLVDARIQSDAEKCFEVPSDEYVHAGSVSHRLREQYFLNQNKYFRKSSIFTCDSAVLPSWRSSLHHLGARSEKSLDGSWIKKSESFWCCEEDTDESVLS